MILRHTASRLADFRVRGIADADVSLAESWARLLYGANISLSSTDPLGDRSVFLRYTDNRDTDLSVKKTFWSIGGEVFDR
jgi:hypothetical protein